MTLPVVVTRSQPGARETADHLTAHGFMPILSPMLQIVETGFDPAALAGVRVALRGRVEDVFAAVAFVPGHRGRPSGSESTMSRRPFQ